MHPYGYFSSPFQVIHRDLALRNLLLTENHIVKISDFGLSLHHSTMSQSSAGNQEYLPLFWWAPESLQSGKHTEKSDVYVRFFKDKNIFHFLWSLSGGLSAWSFGRCSRVVENVPTPTATATLNQSRDFYGGYVVVNKIAWVARQSLVRRCKFFFHASCFFLGKKNFSAISSRKNAGRQTRTPDRLLPNARKRYSTHWSTDRPRIIVSCCHLLHIE